MHQTPITRRGISAITSFELPSQVLSEDEDEAEDDASILEESNEETTQNTKPNESELDRELLLPEGRPDKILLIHNEVQISSCVLYYLQMGLNSPREGALIELFFNLVRVKLTAAMKRVVNLGYVVGCDVRKV